MSSETWRFGSFLHPRLVVLMCAWGFAVDASQPLYARPAPIPEEELIELCDLVVTGEIISVRRLAPQQGSLLAQVKVEETHKGQVGVGRIVKVYFGLPSGAPGDSGIAMYAGERLKLFLLKNERSDAYHPFPHNEAELVDGIEEARHILPKSPGEVIYAPGYQSVVPATRYARPRRFRLFNRR